MEYTKVDEKIKEWLESVIYEENDCQKAESLWANIKNSSGSDEKLSELFSVPIKLIQLIKKDE